MAFTVPKNTPGPSPWHLRGADAPAPGFLWREAGNGPDVAGKTLLVGPAGIYAVLDFQNYVLPLGNGRIVLWHQRFTRSGPTEPVLLMQLRLHQLSPLAGSELELCKTMKARDVPMLCEGELEPAIRLDTTIPRQEDIAFPPYLRDVGELLILCHSSHMDAAPSAERSNLALMVANTRSGTVALYPQDWFNNGGLDYGYQWVTRVARNPQTGRIHGEGIRLSSFVLNEDLRSRSL